MNVLGDLLWMLTGGILVALWYALGGVVLCLTVVGIPFGVQSFRLAGLALFPFGSEIRITGFASGPLGVAMNVLWLLIGGIWLAVCHLALALLMAITIVGLPFARQHFKLARLALMPFGSVIT
ncbi:MAG: YccF domain-containing protein [Anaerolineae bacterium]|nr:YccF domain-containing protein [Anaerolineae bacterium]